MKTRLLNILTGLFCLVMAIGCVYSMYQANAAKPVVLVMWVAVVCAVCMLSRTVVAAIALRKFTEGGAGTDKKPADEPDQSALIEFTVCGKRCLETKDQILEWLSTREGRNFAGGQAILANVTDFLDGEGRKVAYGLLFVGTQEGKKKMEQEYGEYATILDFWPIDPTSWDALFDDDFLEFAEEELYERDQPDLEGVPSEGN